MTVVASPELLRIAGMAMGELASRLENAPGEISTPTLVKIVGEASKLALLAADHGGDKRRGTDLERILTASLPEDRKVALIVAVKGVTAEEAGKMLALNASVDSQEE